MRGYIFTDRERRMLERWLEEGGESQVTRNLFWKTRRGLPRLREDVELMLRVVNRLRRLGRWRARHTARSESGSALRRAESALTRLGRGGST